MTFTNEGTWDRVTRIAVAIALGYAAWTMWPGTGSLVLMMIAAMAFISGIVGYCPGYTMCGWSTARKRAAI